MVVLVDILLIVLSMSALWFGARLTVDAASSIARSFGISERVIGLTIIAFGTSAPEFAVTVCAALKGYSSISVANIVGSNIFNLGFILGGIAVIRQIMTTRKIVYHDCMFLALTTMLLFIFLYDLELSRAEGMMLFAMLIMYLSYLFKECKAETAHHIDAAASRRESAMKSARSPILLLIGLTAVVIGSHILVESARSLASAVGISEWAIGVTIVAAGTSAPEFVTSLVAALKGRHELSVGNLIGSDIFNCVGVLGIAGTLRPLSVDPHARISVCMLSLMVSLILIFMRTGWKLSRAEGLMLLSVAITRWIFDLT